MPHVWNNCKYDKRLIMIKWGLDFYNIVWSKYYKSYALLFFQECRRTGKSAYASEKRYLCRNQLLKLPFLPFGTYWALVVYMHFSMPSWSLLINDYCNWFLCYVMMYKIQLIEKCEVITQVTAVMSFIIGQLIQF